MSRADENALAAGALARPDDDIPRIVYAGWLEENGREKLAADLMTFSLAIRPFVIGGDGGYGGDGDGGYGGYGDDGYGYYGDDGYGDGGDGYGDGGDGYGDGYGNGGDGGGYRKSQTLEITDMRDGLYILTIPSGYNPYVLIGWVKVSGLEIELHGARIIRRLGGSSALSSIAVDGPATATELLKPSPVEYLFRPNIGRVIPADPKKWKKECPQPNSWTGDEN